MEAIPRPARWKILLAFAIIYLVWGSTFSPSASACVEVATVPGSLECASSPPAIALYAWMRAKGTASPTRREWASVHFSLSSSSYSTTACSFGRRSACPRALRRSMLATIPVFMALAEILFLRTQALTLRAGPSRFLIGIGGVAVLVTRSASLGEGAIDKSERLPYRCPQISWSLAAVLPASCHCPNRR